MRDAAPVHKPRLDSSEYGEYDVERERGDVGGRKTLAGVDVRACTLIRPTPFAHPRAN